MSEDCLSSLDSVNNSKVRELVLAMYDTKGLWSGFHLNEKIQRVELHFSNGYRLSVVWDPAVYGGLEAAVLFDCRIVYDPPFEDGVIGFLDRGSLSSLIKQVSSLSAPGAFYAKRLYGLVQLVRSQISNVIRGCKDA